MKPSFHLIVGFLFVAFLYLISPETGIFNLSLVFLSSVLIDVDHYFYYVYSKSSFNLWKAYTFLSEQRMKLKELGKNGNDLSSGLYIFHGLEVLLLVFILSFLFKPLYFIFIGLSFHLLLDLVEEAVYSNRIEKFSLVNDFLNYKK